MPRVETKQTKVTLINPDRLGSPLHQVKVEENDTAVALFRCVTAREGDAHASVRFVRPWEVWEVVGALTALAKEMEAREQAAINAGGAK